MMRASTCCVCERDNRAIRLTKCANTRCPNYVCDRHKLRYEISTDFEMTFADYCSRTCYMESVRKSLPISQEMWIAFVVTVIGMTIYLSLVSMFV